MSRRRPGRPRLVPGEHVTRVTVALTKAQAEHIRAIAHATGAGVSALVRRAIEYYYMGGNGEQ